MLLSGVGRSSGIVPPRPAIVSLTALPTSHHNQIAGVTRELVIYLISFCPVIYDEQLPDLRKMLLYFVLTYFAGNHSRFDYLVKVSPLGILQHRLQFPSEPKLYIVVIEVFYAVKNGFCHISFCLVCYLTSRALLFLDC